INTLLSNQIKCLLRLSNDSLLITYSRGGLSLYDPLTNAFSHHMPGDNNLPNFRVNTVFEDSEKNIWLGLITKGLYHFDGHYFKHVFDLPDIDSANSIINLQALNSIGGIIEIGKTLWFATANGLYSWDKKQPKPTFFHYTAKTQGAKARDSFYKILFDGN